MIIYNLQKSTKFNLYLKKILSLRIAVSSFKKSGGFFLVIFGALLLIVAPTIYPSTPELGGLALVAGFLIGGLGFYIKFLKKTNTN